MAGRTFPIPGIAVSDQSVNPDVQEFMNDIIYRVLYSDKSAFAALLRRGCIEESELTSALTSDFNTAAAALLAEKGLYGIPVYPNVSQATMSISSFVVINGSANISWSVSVIGTDGKVITAKAGGDFGPDTFA